MADYEWLRFSNAILSAIGLLGWILWVIKNRKRWLYSLAPLTLLGHATVFYISILFWAFPSAAVNNWSTILRTHTLLVISLTPYVLLVSNKMADRE